jgi:Tfp pilus assembly protein PilV
MKNIGKVKKSEFKTMKCNDAELRQGQRGFTLVEIIVSWMLVLLSLLFICRVVVFAFDSFKKSRIRLHMSQKLESAKDLLLSKPFHSSDLEEGYTAVEEGLFKIDRKITDLSATLKRIRLSISYKTLTRQLIFYKSKYIQEVKND